MRKGQSRQFVRHFDKFACEGDSITAELPGGFTARARIERDDNNDKPDERDCGFWPSKDSKSDGYLGPVSERAFQNAQRRAEAIMEAWRNDEWFYCGVCVTIEKEGVQLTGKYDHALWGIECNYPSKRRVNSYLRCVANELLPDALETAHKAVADLRPRERKRKDSVFASGG